MKSRIFPRLILPGTLVLMVLLLACQQSVATPTPEAAPSRPSAAQTTRPLTDSEREAVADFAAQYEALEQEWAVLRADFDGWRSGLTECHPSAAQEALSDFTTSFKEITEAARGLPRTASTKELADLIIPAAEAEETAFRTLRDRWLPGNTSFFESVEQRRTGASNAQKATEDRSLELQVEFEAGATEDDVAEAKTFSVAFDEIEDAWQDFHDEYRQLRNKESKLDVEDVLLAYQALALSYASIVESLDTLEGSDILQDLIETLDNAADDESDALGALIEALEGGIADPAPPPRADAASGQETPGAAMAAAPAQPAVSSAQPAVAVPPSNGEGAGPTPPSEAGNGQDPNADPGAGQPPAPPPGSGQQVVMPVVQPPAATSRGNGNGNGNGNGASIFHGELDEAYEASIAAMAQVSLGIEEIVEDNSAERLSEVLDFNEAYEGLLAKWQSFHEDYDSWREDDGGCDRISTLDDLDGFAREAAALAARVRDLPRNGYLLPAYTLVVEAAEREEGAMRALYNSWRPFATDSFATVDRERSGVDRLRQQAMTGLQELDNRP